MRFIYLYIQYLIQFFFIGIFLMTWVACSSNQTSNKRGMYRYLSTPIAKKNINQSCQPDQAPSTWGVIIGINQYKDEGISDLKGSVSDAWIIYHYLTSPQGGHVDTRQLKLLLNQEATRTNVEGAIGNFLSQSCPKDRIIIYFAGHGAPEPGRPNDAFLLMHDTKLDNMVGSAISMQRLPNFLQWRNTASGNLLLIVDACHSGNITFPQTRGVKKPPKVEALERSKVIDGTLKNLGQQQQQWSVISAAASHQYAGELKGSCGGDIEYTGGVFTCKLLKGLSGKADKNRDGQMSIEEVYHFVHEEVSKETGGMQTPVFSGAKEQKASFFPVPKTKSKIEIPKVPQMYLIEEYKSPYRMYRWISYGVTLGSILSALYFNQQTNDLTREANQFLYRNRTETEYQKLLSEKDTAMSTTQVMYGVSSLLGLTTLVISLLEHYDLPQGRREVYQLTPWFSLPSNEAAMSGLKFQF